MDGSTVSPITERIRCAKLYLADGFELIEVRRGSKVPVADGAGTWNTTRDLATVLRWFEDRDSNYGIVSGPSHVWVDVDSKSGKRGDKHLQAMEAKEPPDEWISPNTRAQRSPSGGAHYLCRVPFPVSSSPRFPEGIADIDIRGVRGFVLGAGSVLIAGLCGAKDVPGPYTLESDAPIMGVPAWLLVCLQPQGERDKRATESIVELDLPENVDRARQFLRTCRPAIETQGGDKWTKDTASCVGDLGISESLCFDLMSDLYNPRCEPSWDDAELEKKIENAYRYREQPLGCKACDSAAMDEAMELMYADADLAEPAESKRPTGGIDFRIYTGAAILTTIKRRETIIPGVLLDIGNHHFVATRGAGKTATLLDMGLSIASDMPWHGLPVKPGFHVAYGALEDAEGAVENIRAWCIEHQRPIPERFHLIDEPFNLMSAEDVERWTREILRRLNGGRAVTILDTWGRAISRAQHGTNNDAEMRTANANVEQMARDLRGPSASAAHPPKDLARVDTVRGSGVQEDDSAAIWVLRSHKEDNNGNPVKLANLHDERRFVVERFKGSPAKPIVFQLKKIDLGETDEQGQPRSGIVVAKRGIMSRMPITGEPIVIENDRHAVAQAIADSVHQGQPPQLTKVVERLANKTAHGFDFPGRNKTVEIIKSVLGVPVKLDSGMVWLAKGANNNGWEVRYQNVGPETIKGPFPDDESIEIEFPIPPVS